MGSRAPHHFEVGRIQLLDDPDIEIVVSVAEPGLSLVGSDGEFGFLAIGMWVEPELDGPLLMCPADVLALSRLLITSALPMVKEALENDGANEGNP